MTRMDKPGAERVSRLAAALFLALGVLAGYVAGQRLRLQSLELVVQRPHVRLLSLTDGQCSAMYVLAVRDGLLRSDSARTQRWPAKVFPGGGLGCFLDEVPAR